MEALEALKLARTRLSNDKPYFAGALWALRLVEESKCPTAGIDEHWRVYYNPEFIENIHKALTIKGTMAILLHEVSHALRRHSTRAKLMGITYGARMVWNVAVDMEINDDLDRDSHVKLFDEACRPKNYDFPSDLSGEEYYEKLFREGHVQEVGPGGSGATGFKEEWEHPGSGGPSNFEKEAIRKDTARRIREHCKSRGTVPGGWQRWAEAELGGKVDWRKQLASILRRSVAEVRGLVDYSYRAPNRRQYAFGPIIMPTMFRPVPSPAVVIDTSGSMSDEDLGMCLTELKGILQAVGLRGVRYYAVDAEITSSKVVTSARQVTLAGGGGTDMCVGINKALEQHPDLIVVLTDGYTPWPETPLPCRLVCCIINSDSDGPAWAKTIKIKRGG